MSEADTTGVAHSTAAPPGDRGPPAIVVAGLTKAYGEVVALRNVDLEVEPGSIVGLVGPNGAGKTTLLRLLVGALRPDEGRVEVLGRDPLRDRRIVRASIGYMPQARVLYQDLTVGENVAFFARGHGLPDVDARVRTVVAFVDLVDAIDRPVRTLSGGQQQRVSMAAALVHDPQIVFLDEPTAGVDPELRHTFWQRFRDLAGTGRTLVISTHQMDEVIHCDRVSLIRAGVVLADSTPAELFESGGSTVRVVSDAGVADHRVGAVSDDLPRLLREFGLAESVRRIEVLGPTLEDVILGLIESGHRESE